MTVCPKTPTIYVGSVRCRQWNTLGGFVKFILRGDFGRRKRWRLGQGCPKTLDDSVFGQLRPEG